MGSTRFSAQGAVGRGLSPAIWQAYGFTGGDFGDPSLKPFFFDDFAKLGVMDSTVSQGGYITLQEGSSTIQQCADTDNSKGEFGVLEIGTFDGNNEEASIELGSGVGGLVRIDPTSGERAVVAFEARIKRTTVTDDHTSFAIGLGQPGWAVTNALHDDTCAIYADGTMKSFVGFSTTSTSSNEEVDAVYAIATVNTVNQVKDNAGTAVADTWQKLGIVFDPYADDGKKVKYFIDGVEIVPTSGSEVTDLILTTGTAFPTDHEMTPVLLAKNSEAVSHPLYMDWWAVGSYSVDT